MVFRPTVREDTAERGKQPWHIGIIGCYPELVLRVRELKVTDGSLVVSGGTREAHREPALNSVEAI